ncbi:BTB/POZ domain-containing protein [Thalictrum thalictroides]|uniref:BTB/POZ domain-containing protein n=1 Tax=Thalictrum thalictroides TaxID=46969 RepID=A0A7J6VX93_THATH|nr:BTB/POZ domain-containing protein [Thalictrum thalictroides]
MEGRNQYSNNRGMAAGSMKVVIPPSLSQQSSSDDNDGNGGEGIELRGGRNGERGERTTSVSALDSSNLVSLCDHIQLEGFNSGSFSDVVVQVMNSTYHLHRLILSRSSYFRNMLHGPWKEAHAPVLNLHVDDDNVNGEAIAVALAYLYGHHPKLNDSNAFRVLAAASFLDLQIFAEGQDYGIHGERVRNACWGFLCQSGDMELKEVLPKLSSQTLHALLTSDELWVPTEEKRFELALYTLLAKAALLQAEEPEDGSSSFEMGKCAHSDSSGEKAENVIDNNKDKQLIESENLSLKDDCDGHKTAHNILVQLADCVVDFHSEIPNSKPSGQEVAGCQLNQETRHPGQKDQDFMLNSLSHPDGNRTSYSYVEMPSSVEASRMRGSGVAMEGPSEESTCYHVNTNVWLPRDQTKQCSSASSSCNNNMPNEWGRCGMPPPSWGGRVVGRRQVKSHANGYSDVLGEEYDAFINIFEGGSLLYCNMSFEGLLNVRKQLEEMGFPCKAANDGLWLQMLLSHKVQEIGADTCKNCCLTSMACACRQYGFSQGTTTGYYMQDHDRNNPSGSIGNIYVTDAAQGEGNGFSRPVRVHVRGPIDGLAGIGRGNTFVPATSWQPTRFVFSRVPFGVGNRNGQQSLAHEESEARADYNSEVSGDGLTALVGLSQGGGNVVPVHGEQVMRIFEPDVQSRYSGATVPGPNSSGIPIQMLESDHDVGLEWENEDRSSISLDTKTPLRQFPPFRFGVEFEDVHRLNDGQVKHSTEVFYAGSLWKVSVQAFNDEDPQGRRTLGLFLHRRKAEVSDSVRKIHMYIDSREKVTARYQLICPSKREVMVFGSFKQTGTLLPKAPKGWGWRTALLFDELTDLLQGGSLRIAAVVQLV